MLDPNQNNRILIIGNSGSGKSFLASQLSEKLSLKVTHFDSHFWEPGGFNKKRNPEIVFQEISSLAQENAWIMEGVFGELALLALENATLLIFLDMSWEVCQESLLMRGSESSRQLDPIQAEENFRKLLEWANNYWIRTGTRSHTGHQQIYEKAQSSKMKIKERDEINHLFD